MAASGLICIFGPKAGDHGFPSPSDTIFYFLGSIDFNQLLLVRYVLPRQVGGALGMLDRVVDLIVCHSQLRQEALKRVWNGQENLSVRDAWD